MGLRGLIQTLPQNQNKVRAKKKEKRRKIEGRLGMKMRGTEIRRGRREVGGKKVGEGRRNAVKQDCL